ncbi:MAG: hypothetical protein AB7I38_03350 [Dehalococcoidia bacterium]
MRRRLVLLVASTAAAVAGLTVLGAVVLSDSTRVTPAADTETSSVGTTAQKSPGNTGSFVDLTDNPVSLPAERTIYPPRTGNAGFAAVHQNAMLPLALVGAATVLIAIARASTRRTASR